MHPSDIRIGQSELSIIELYDMVQSGQIDFDLDAKTWNKNRMSMSIESVLLGLTVTPMYFDASNPEKWLVLDGQKRLKSIVSFISNKFELKDLEILVEFNGMKYNSMPKVFQRRLVQSKFTIYSINQGVPPDVRLSLIRRILPDTKSGLSIKMLESLLTPIAKELLRCLETNNHFMYTISQTKIISTMELEVKYLKTLYSQYCTSIFDGFDSTAKTEDIIIKTNKYALSNFEFIQNTWDIGLERIDKLFEIHAFKTTPKALYINKYVFDALIIYFGNIITDLDYSLLIQNRNRYTSLWFELFHSAEGKRIFRRISPYTKFEKLNQLTYQIIAR